MECCSGSYDCSNPLGQGALADPLALTQLETQNGLGLKLQFSVNPVTTYEKGLTSYEAVSQRPQDFSFSPERRDAASLDAVMEEFIRLDFTS